MAGRARATSINYLQLHTNVFQSFTLVSGKGGLGSTKFVAFETQAWHNECFFCAQCKISMVGKGFIQVKKNTPKNASLYILFTFNRMETT